MPIEIRKATSKEMKKNIRVVKMMTRGMQFDENMAKVNWKAVRRISGIGYTFMPREKGVKVYRLRIGNGKSEISIPDNVNDDVLIMYIHGGGFVSGSAASSRGYCSMLAKATGYKVVAVDYRLAPENPYPSGLDDCYEMFCKLAQKYPKAEIVLCGESAGANLCLALCHRINAECDDRLAAVIVHSPFMDFTGSLSRGEHEVDDFTVKEGCLPALNEIYVGKHNADDLCISPLYGDYKNFPPTFITCDYNETLYADSMELYRMCEDAGVDVRMIQMQGAFHAFATMGTGTPETMKILEDMKLFINKSIHKKYLGNKLSHHYQCFISTFPISILFYGDVLDYTSYSVALTENDRMFDVNENVHVLFSPVILPGNKYGCMQQEDYPFVVRGIEKVVEQIRKKSEFDNTLIIFHELEYLYADRQEEGFVVGAMEWAAKAFGFERPEVKVAFDKENRKYVF